MKLKVNKYRLDNGLKILINEDHSLPLVGYYTFFKVGSRNERPGITGISHLFEHMMFNGSKKFGPKEFDRILESNGGFSNAYTTRDITVYYENFSPSAFRKVVEMEADRMENLALNETNLSFEREVVKEERRLRTDNSIMGIMEEQLYAASFYAHPYRWPVIGWMSDLDNITLKDCQDYYRKYYSPDNAVLVIIGDVNPLSSFEVIKDFYGNIPPGKIDNSVVTEEPEQKGERRIKYFKEANSISFCIGYHTVSVFDEDVFPLDLLQIILTYGGSSRLYRNLVLKKRVATSIFSEFAWRIDPSLFVFYVRMKPGIKAEKGEEIIYNEIEKIKKKGITKK
ncbi:insulinase family protein, partial [candidate division KSB1 bacterium]